MSFVRPLKGDAQVDDLLLPAPPGLQRALDECLNRAGDAQFNMIFIDKEEESVIRLRSLEDEAKDTGNNMEAVGKVFKNYVDFHGEMLLLVHWSILAYTGLVKILKKHHKRTGLLVRAPHLDNLLSQPFCSVEVRPSGLRVCTLQ